MIWFVIGWVTIPLLLTFLAIKIRGTKQERCERRVQRFIHEELAKDDQVRRAKVLQMNAPNPFLRDVLPRTDKW